MSWNYSGDPSTSTKDAVRYYVGDTDTNEQLVQDEEINFVLNNEGGRVLQAAHFVAQTIMAKLAKKVDVTDKSSGMAIRRSLKFQQYKELVASLRKKIAIHLSTPYLGGESVADKQSNEDDTDRLQPAFTRALHDVPGTNINPTDTDSLIDV
jgi:hypothetical protein